MKPNFLIAIFALTLSLVGISSSHAAVTPLVDAQWVKTNAGSDNKVFIDLRSKTSYLQGHVPGAVHSSYGKDKWRMKQGEIKGMLPPTKHLTKLIGKLGIDNNTHVILLHGGYSAVETGIATRVYWTFKVLGHDQVSILNGGMTGYLKDKTNPLEKVAAKPVAKTFTATINTAVLATAKDVSEGLKSGSTMLDSRPTDQHLGVNKSGAITRTGTLPGAISVPGRWVTINDKGTFRSISSLRAIYSAKLVSDNKNRIVFCNTGHWASLGWFVDSELLGNKKSKMYDGSMAQWSRLPAASHPMTVKLNLQ